MSRASVELPRARFTVVLVLAGLLGVLAVLVTAGPVAAHASLVDTDPAEGEVLATAPEQVRLTFDERVELTEGAIRLFDAAGDELEVQAQAVQTEVAVTPPQSLADGTYVLSWRVISADAHPVAGSLSFSVGAPSTQVAQVPQAQNDTTVTWALGVAQGVTFLGLTTSAGLLLFLLFFLPAESGLDPTRRRVRRLAADGTGVTAVAAVLLIPLGALNQQGLGLTGLFTAAPWSDVAGAEGALALLILAGLAGAVAASDDGIAVRWRSLGALTGTAFALGSLALVGHTRAYDPVPLVMATDVAHVLTAAVWFGGLTGLALTLPMLTNREATAATTLARFSTVAAGLLVLLTVTGSVLAWRILGSWNALLTTGYGTLLLIKVGVVAVAVAVAGWNRYRLLPRVTGETDYRSKRSAARLLTTTIRVEASLIVTVLLLTGFLVNRSPEVSGSTAAAEPVSAPQPVSARGQGVRVVARMSPQRVGTNTIEIRLQDNAGQALQPIAEPVVSMSSPDIDLGSQPVTNVSSGTYRLRTTIPARGHWVLEVSVRTSQFQNPVVSLHLPVAP